MIERKRARPIAIQVGSVDAAMAAAAITKRVRGYLRMLGAVRP